MADFRKVAPGDDVTIWAETWNAMLDAARAERARSGDTSERSYQPREGTIVRVKNETGSDLPRHSVLGLAAPLFLPTASQEAFLRDVTLRGVIPQAAHKDRYAVTLDPLKAGAIGRAHVDGVTPVKVNVTNAAHAGCEAVPGNTGALVSTGSGTAASILWREGGTGVQWGLIRMDSVCDCAPTVSPCCGGGLPSTLYLSDGLGTVELLLDGPHPPVLSTPPFTTEGMGWWWGCAPRSAAGMADSCAGPATLTTHLYFAFRCGGYPGYPGLSNEFHFRVFGVCCRHPDGLRSYNIAGYGCTDDWPTVQTDAAHVVVYRPSNIAEPALSCDPLAWTITAATGFGQVYGETGTATWTITE